LPLKNVRQDLCGFFSINAVFVIDKTYFWEKCWVRVILISNPRKKYSLSKLIYILTINKYNSSPLNAIIKIPKVQNPPLTGIFKGVII